MGTRIVRNRGQRVFWSGSNVAAAVLEIPGIVHTMAVCFGALKYSRIVWPIIGKGGVCLLSKIHPFGACFSLKSSPEPRCISRFLIVCQMRAQIMGWFIFAEILIDTFFQQTPARKQAWASICAHFLSPCGGDAPGLDRKCQLISEPSPEYWAIIRS